MSKTEHQSISGITALFIEHSTFLKKYLARYLHREEDLEDVVQEVYLKARKAEQDVHIEQPKAFLFSVARNLALNELTKKSRQMTGYLEECLPQIDFESATSTEQEVEAAQTLGNYCEAIAALPEKCRRVYLLRKVHGLSHKEIAQRLGISAYTVDKHLRNGAERCHDYLERIANGRQIGKARRRDSLIKDLNHE